VKLLEKLRIRRAERRIRRAELLDEQAKLRQARDARGAPGAETHGMPPDAFGGGPGI
jgi:hypothetical protein